MEWSQADLEAFFGKQLDCPVRLAITDNIRSMVSFRSDNGGGVRLRLHRMFTRAPTDILLSVAAWVETPHRRAPAVREFMQENREAVRPATPKTERRPVLRPRGKFHDLDRVFARVNAEYFDSQVEMRITWGRRSRKRYPRQVCLGTWCEETNVITISPRLDRRNVPQYFVAFVVYHEMLHARLGVGRSASGRRRIHTREFRRLERQFRDYDRAIAFENRFFG